jgi:hypothetical protein
MPTARTQPSQASPSNNNQPFDQTVIIAEELGDRSKSWACSSWLWQSPKHFEHVRLESSTSAKVESLLMVENLVLE